ncbi:hypothetical protein D3C85_1620550 [compost metagenome]
MGLRRCPGTARQDEITQYRQLGAIGINLLLESQCPAFIDLPQGRTLRLAGKGQLTSQIKKLLLQQYQLGQ